MRLTLTTFLTLDGVYQGPGGPNEDESGGFQHGGWLVPYFNEEVGQFMTSVFEEVDAFVLGRTADWNNSTILSGDPVAEVAKLKEQPGRELQIHGSGALAQTLFDANLIDTFRFLYFPVVLGTGKRLFAEGRTPSALKLTDVKTSTTGVTMQTFELAGKPTYGTVGE